MSSRDAILAAIPHRDPFLLVDEVVDCQDDRITCRKHFTGEEYFFAGHYPGAPLVPGVLLCEAAMQAGAILIARRLAASPDDFAGKVPVATRLNDVRFKRMVRPGETIDIEVSLREQLSGAYFLDAKVTCAGKVAVRFEFACTLAEAPS